MSQFFTWYSRQGRVTNTSVSHQECPGSAIWVLSWIYFVPLGWSWIDVFGEAPPCPCTTFSTQYSLSLGGRFPLYRLRLQTRIYISTDSHKTFPAHFLPTSSLLRRVRKAPSCPSVHLSACVRVAVKVFVKLRTRNVNKTCPPVPNLTHIEQTRHMKTITRLRNWCL
jgi:hypothetical protein